MALLYNSLAGKPKKLEETKETATTLSFPIPGVPLLLTTDASSVAVGAVIK